MKKILSLCSVILVLCGCGMKAEYNMNIKSDKSMDFAVIIAYDDELIDAMISMDESKEEYTEEEGWQMLEDSMESENSPENYGFTKERYNEGEYHGFKYVKTISNIDNISSEQANFKLEEFEKISESILFVKSGNKYKANFELSSEEQENNSQGADIGIEMIFTVTLPREPISHNAATVSEDGKTLTWNLTEKGVQNIEFEFSFTDNTMLYIGVAASLVLVVTIVSIIIYKNKKKQVI